MYILDEYNIETPIILYTKLCKEIEDLILSKCKGFDVVLKDVKPTMSTKNTIREKIQSFIQKNNNDPKYTTYITNISNNRIYFEHVDLLFLVASMIK